MTVTETQARIAQVVEHPTLIDFNHDFGAASDLSRYDSIPTNERVTSAEAIYLNQLQMDSFIPTRIALLLKNNLRDAAFITHTTRSALFELKQEEKIGEECFNFLHEKLNAQDFLGVFRYLYVVMLYGKISEAHAARTPDPAFRFEPPMSYSNKLVRTPIHLVFQEEIKLQNQARKQFLKECLLQTRSRFDCPRAVQQQVSALLFPFDTLTPSQFRTQFISFIAEMEKFPGLEGICWKDLSSNLSPYHGEEFLNQAYLRLKTESYYKNCLNRVTTLRQSLENTQEPALVALIEKCKKSYNGCIYLLGDSKNMPACSTTRFSALTGKMRTEWQAINNVFNRAQNRYTHSLCACQVQSPASQNKLASWPYNPLSLVDLKPAPPASAQQLQQRGISTSEFQENQKKTVAIFGAKWGGGHIEVSRGIANNLSSLGYHPLTVDLPELMMPEDPIRNFFLTRWLGASWSSVTLYEGLLRERAFAFINFILWVQSKLFSPFGYSDREFKIILDYLLKLNPDSVITTNRTNHEAIIEACKVLGIPYMHVATDVDTTLESRDKPTDFNHFKIAMPFDTPEAINPILNTTTEEQRFTSGPPVRHAFTHTRTFQNVQEFKSKWGIDSNKKVVVITSGKNGAFSPYAEMLAKKYAETDPRDIPIHVVVICGGTNKDFKRHLEQDVAPHTKLPMTIALSYNEEKMEELLSMASYGGALVGKAGGGTIFESFARGARVLVDDVRPGLFSQGIHHFWITAIDKFLRLIGFAKQMPWEKINMDFAKKHGLATVFEEEKDFLSKLDQTLSNDGRPVPLSVEVKNVEKTIPATLRTMLTKAAASFETRTAREAHKNL